MTIDFNEIPHPTTILVTAPWCHNCRAMTPLVEEAVAQSLTSRLIHVDTAADPDTAVALGVRGVPTLIGMANGKEVVRLTGRRTLDEIRAAIRTTEAPRPAEGIGSLRRKSAIDGPTRLGAGAALTVAGLLLGPAWPLVGIGSAISLWGVIGWPGR